MTVVGRVVAAGMIVAGTIALGGTAQAAAVTRRADSSGQITSPADGQVLSSSSVTVSALTGVIQLNVGLYVEGPSTPSRKVAGGGANQTISGTFDAGNAPNGTFTVTLKGEITGSSYATSTFKLRRPPEAPGNVKATRQGSAKVRLTWSKGSEPDLQSYEVSNSQSGIVGRLPAGSACAGSTCQAVLAVPTKAKGQKVGFTVKAFRGDGDGGSIGSGNSAAAYVAFPAAPTPTPTKKKTTGTRTPKTTKNVDPLPTLPAKRQTLPTTRPTTHKRTTAKLPAIPDADPNGNLPIPTTGETGGLRPSDAKNGADTAPVQPDVKAQSVESPIGNLGQYGLYVAAGILLLLFGAHAGAWARRRALATGESSTSGTATAATGVGVAAAGGVQVTHANESASVATAPPRRRPAVILAVAKTRVPDQSRAQQAGAGEPSDGAAPERSPSPPALDRKREEAAAAFEVEEVRDVPEARQGPVRITLSSSAVTDVPESDAAPVRPAVRMEDRWDDYLPPSPRSMEDSGFWERPQPGAADFWSGEDEEKGEGEQRAYVGPRHRDGES
ncbi:hypothetical protein [Nonomuraea sp. NPDC005650]|uniref:hypothetical protein n=1 Tax=Nonomuraea sp. NPDC005650 TaxID=3157045 RepID=UPI0033A1CE43